MKLLCRLLVCCALDFLLIGCEDKSHVGKSTGIPDYVIQKGNTYIISQGDAQLEIMANYAGRISSLKIGGQEMLVTPKFSGAEMWGNTFWTSPQSEWNWPPLETLDSAPYAVSYENNRIVFTSDVEKKTGYQFIKSYGLNTEKKCLSVRYSIYNKSKSDKTIAPWEVTRLKPGGIAFFPQGNTESTSGIFYPIPVEHILDITWATYDPQKIRDNHHKLITDGKEGWLAFADKGRLLVKEFADVPVELIVSGEGEIELFANTEKSYWEVDEQGAMATLKPNEHLQWEVLWHMRVLPTGINIVNGNPDLINYVRGVLGGRN